LLRNFLVDNTRNLVIFLDDRSFSDHHFRTMIALETTLSKENSSLNFFILENQNHNTYIKIL
ncbi:hypothetical protein, partial [Streptococcus pneumoniae]